MSEAKKGKKRLPKSEESKKKVSESLKKYHNDRENGINNNG